MRKLKEGKKIYENIEIPRELEYITKDLIRQNKPKNKFRYIYSTAAVFLLFILVGVNVSQAFATTFSKIPLIGEIVYVVSMYGKKIDEDKTINTEIPKISSEDKNVEDIAKRVNKEIENIVNNYTKEAEKHIEEYKQAFISTGGTEEEFNQKNITVDVSYDIKFQSKDYLSLVLNANESWVNAYNVSYFYNIDLNTGNDITLKDLLGDDYINIANKSIKSQIEQQIQTDKNISYFGYGNDDSNIDGFQTIADKTKFYINEAGNPVIVFDKYEIAPGYMGSVSFEVK